MNLVDLAQTLLIQIPYDLSKNTHTKCLMTEIGSGITYHILGSLLRG